MSGLKLDPEYKEAMKAALQEVPPDIQDVLEIRAIAGEFLPALLSHIPRPAAMDRYTFAVTSSDGTSIAVTRFASPVVLTSTLPLSAVVYLHGGAMVAGTVDLYAPLVAHRADESGVPFFAVEYRLAPEYKAPCAVMDCYAAVEYLIAHAAELNIDPAKIALMGESAGGGIAAGTALLARDRGLHPPLAKQILVYPMLDDRTELPASAPILPFLAWNSNNNVKAWKAYVVDSDRGSSEAGVVSCCAAPARATDGELEGLPSTYIEVGSLDLFADEGMEFARRLLRRNVEVELHVWPGLPHSFDAAAGISWFKRASESRNSAIRRIGL